MSENCCKRTWTRFAGLTAIGILLAPHVFAGGSGLNVAVVVNQNSSDSIQLGNYYCEKRAVPPENVLRINWTGTAVTWTETELNTFLRAPLLEMLTNRKLNNQVEFVLLSMDIPYRVASANGENSTTSALFYGYKTNDCPTCPYPGCTLPAYTRNAYAESEGVFRQSPLVSATSNAWLVMMLTSSNLAQAKAVVDRGVAADFLSPTQKVFLAKSDDVNRNVRYALFDNALFNIQLGGVMNVGRTNGNNTYGLGTMLGYANGYMAFPISGSFAPGAMADSLTSFGGQIFEDSGHTDALDFLNAGATASYGTVVEPCAFLEKFPSPMNYFYQARGFSVAEAYYQSLGNPYQGILVGEPLSAPFARTAAGAWSNLPQHAVLAGTTNLTLQFAAADDRHPLQQVDLFVDGVFAQTISSLPPRSSNILYVTINGAQTNYVVPPGASLKTIASNLTLYLNAGSYSNATKVEAAAWGDRIELRNLNQPVSGTAIPVSTSNYVGSASVLTTFLNAARTNFLDTVAFGHRTFVVTNMPQSNSYLLLAVTMTNGAAVSLGVTNPAGNTNVAVLVQALVDAVNTNLNLTNVDGVIAEDFYSYVDWTGGQWLSAEFNLRARRPGWDAAQLQTSIVASSPLMATPAVTVRLEDNLNDLRPRNHLYLTAGLTNLNFTFPFDTTTNADGYHELTAVAYEGSHVRTQKRISQYVRIQNNSWSATLTTLLGGTNTALEAELQFAVTANTSNITRIEFFTTGGLFAASNNVASATFTIAATYLGCGLHPFYAMVTRKDGTQYRTETKWTRIVGPEPPFAVSILDPAPTLTWPASAGRLYQVLSATNLSHAFIQHAVLIPTNSTGLWTETNNPALQRFYRVETP